MIFLSLCQGQNASLAKKPAEENRISIALCDRDVRVTLRRAWHAQSFFKKSYLLPSLFAGLFDRTEITEEKPPLSRFCSGHQWSGNLKPYWKTCLH
jgi:pheromone shutdown protein TraB